MTIIKSPLRYPGGKSKALDQIVPFLPPKFSSYREPFVGGGSLFIFLKQMRESLPIWINDLNNDLYCFWKYTQNNLDDLVKAIQHIKQETTDGRQLFKKLTAEPLPVMTGFDKAVRFFVLNRITFSGTVDSGGYSQKAFETRFTDSSIQRLSKMEKIMDRVKITNSDYEEALSEEGNDVFIFLDPPYLSVSNSRLYGKRGALHTGFDHQRFASELKKCKHKWLITYDDCAEVRKNFDSFANIYTWQLQYGMNNYKSPTAAKGNELFICNYNVANLAIKEV
jgi:DNA adenine methylase